VEANEAFREILRREMAKRPELSQNAFAKLIGTNSAYLSEILAGKKDGQRLAVRALMNLGAINGKSGCEGTCPLAGKPRKIVQLLMDTLDVIDSDTHWGTSMIANIRSFHDGLELQRKQTDKLQKMMEEVERKIGKGTPDVD
jgi:hypothetical protein